MKLLFSPNFTRASKRLLKKSPKLSRSLQETLKTLESNIFHPILKTHKLEGKLEGHWACSINYDLRIVFKVVQIENAEAILLLTIGTHDEVY
ncbi:MAG: type II toxin-antitoxin system mRNA interferase toxin, RelE/StbE family [Pyrinomonadaceae bacterium]|nr:type II toxin-antitoxin system mRNA interferase toxin, RelE/StbE family [Pyrinomonadaceae bacterium]